MAKARSKTKKGRKAPSTAACKPVDLAKVREEINALVGKEAADMVEITIGEVKKGRYLAMKFLFEMTGIYPATGSEMAPAGDALAKTLLQRLNLKDPPEANTPASAEPEGSAPAECNAVE